MRHELHLTGRGLRAVALLSGPLLAACFLLAGPAGAASAAAGAGIVAANQAAAAASTGWARRLTPNVLAVGYLAYVLRLAGVLTALAIVSGAPWVNRNVLAGAFCAALVTALGAECVSYARGSYVPAWRAGR